MPSSKVYPSPYNRHREMGGFHLISGTYTSYDASCDHLGTWLRDSGGLAITGSKRSTNDVVTPGYIARSKRGEIINNGFGSSYEQHDCTGSGGVARSKPYFCAPSVSYSATEDRGDGPWFGWYHLSGSDHSNPPRVTPSNVISTSDIDAAILVAATKAWGDTNGNNANLPQDIAEIHQLINMVRHPLQVHYSLFRSIMSKKRASYAKAKKANALTQWAASNWLQYRFGVRPLVSSVNGILETVKNRTSKLRRTCRGSYSMSATSQNSGLDVRLLHDIAWEDVTEHKFSVHAGILVEDIVSTAGKLGFDASNMLALPWELVPYSFVADWFANVGDFLYSVIPSVSIHPLSTWYTMRSELTRTLRILSATIHDPSAYDSVSAPHETRTCKQINVNRIPRLPSPGITFKPRSIQKVSSDLRTADTFALVANLANTLFRH